MLIRCKFMHGVRASVKEITLSRQIMLSAGPLETGSRGQVKWMFAEPPSSRSGKPCPLHQSKCLVKDCFLQGDLL